MDDPIESGRRGDQANEKLHESACSPNAGTDDAAADGYDARHRERFAERIEGAQRAMLNGKAATLAYLLGISEQDVERLGGVADGRDRTVRSAYGDLEPGDRARDHP